MTFPWHTEIFLDAPRLWPLALAIALIGVIVVIRLYVPQVRTLALAPRLLLPTLRAAAVIALAVSILKPVAVHKASPSDPGEVIFLLDRTGSMGVRDLAWLGSAGAATRPDQAAGAGLSHLVSLADAFGMLPAGARDSQLGVLRGEIEHAQQTVHDLMQMRNEFVYARASGQDPAPSRIRIAALREEFRGFAGVMLQQVNSLSKSPLPAKSVEALQSFAHAGRAMQLEEFVRELDLLARWTDKAQSAQDLQLYQSNQAVRAACDKIASLSRYDRVELALSRRGGGEESNFLSKLPSGESISAYSVGETTEPIAFDRQRGPAAFSQPPSEMSTDLVDAVQTALSHAAGRPVQAIVLFSDGRQPSDRSSVSSLSNPSNTPIFSVDAAAPQSLLKDVSVAGLAAPDCFVGETITARAQLQSSNSRQTTADVSLSIDGRHAATRPAMLTDQPVTVEFPINFEKPGIRRLEVSVSTSPDSPTDQNKSAQRFIKVMDDKVNVGVFAGSPDWDYQYLSNALSRTPWINLNRALLQPGGSPLDLSPDQILQLDLLILDDVPISALTRDQWIAVNRLVSDRGGSVLLVAGEENLQRYILHPLTAALLPFPIGESAAWRDWPGNEAGFHLAPAAGTSALDALKLFPTLHGAQVEQYWSQLPAFFRYLSLPSLKPAARTLLVERDSSSPILVENRVGLGRSFFLGMHETWRWRYKVGERDQDRFWLQLVRYAADAPYAVHTGGVWLDADPVSAQPMQPIHVRARVVDASQAPSQSPTQTVEVVRDGQVARKLILTQVDQSAGAGGVGRYEGTLVESEPGDEQLRLASPAGFGAAVLPLHIARDAQQEMSNIAGDPQFLRQLSQDSGGQMLNLDQLQSLPQLINHAAGTQTRLIQQPIWDSYYLYGFVLACLGVEWAIRKRVGLA